MTQAIFTPGSRNECVCVLKWAGGGENGLGHFYPTGVRIVVCVLK